MTLLTRDKLHGYQDTGVQFIKDVNKCALWLDLGLGKTVTTLTATVDLLNSVDVHHVLVVAPLRVAKSTWPNEIDNWQHTKDLSYAVACGTPEQRIRAVKLKADVTLINVENLVWLVDLLGKRWPYDMVVIDESSAFKAHNTKRFRALKRVSHLVHRMVQLTGTPAPNGLTQLWSQIFLLDQGKRLMKTLTGFRTVYCQAIPMGPHIKYKVPESKAPEIYDKIEDIVLTMKAEDYLDMPEKIEVFHDIELNAKQRKTYRELETECLLELDDNEEISAVNAAALSGKLIQFANGAVYKDGGGYEVFHDAKLETLATMIDESNRSPMLVAYYFKSDLERLQKKFPKAKVLDKDPATIDAWNRGEIDVLLLHPASAGHGLNLQKGGNVIVWFSLTWNLELYLQLIGRLLRQGQAAATVLVHHLNIIGSIDDDVTAAIRDKDQTQEALLTALKKRLKK